MQTTTWKEQQIIYFNNDNGIRTVQKYALEVNSFFLNYTVFHYTGGRKRKTMSSASRQKKKKK